MMKTKSKLLMCLMSFGCLVSCTSLSKNTALNENFRAKQKIVATTPADLIKANRPDQYYEIARQYQKKGSYNEAVIAYQKSLQLDPGYTKSITGLATVFADQKLYNLSIPLFEQVTKLEPNAVNYNNLGYAYFLNNQYVEANRVLTQAIMLEPNYLQAQKNLDLVAKNQPTVTNSDLTQQENNAVPNINQTVELEPVDSGKADKTSKLILPVNEPQIVSQDLTINAAEIQPKPKMIQTASATYELSMEQPREQPKAIAANIDSANNPRTNAFNAPNDILVSISGGIKFSHIPGMAKLFDLATNTIGAINLNDSSKFVEIINGNGIKGIARAVASRLEDAGNVQLKVADSKRFNQSRTHIQYKSGYRDNAVSLNNSLKNKPYLVRNDNLPNDVALRLVLGRDILQEISKSAIHKTVDAEKLS